MANHNLQNLSQISKQEKALLAFNKNVVINAVNDLDIAPNRKVFLLEQLTNKKLFPSTSMIQEIQKEQMIDDSSKPLINAIKNIDKQQAIENQQLSLDNKQKLHDNNLRHLNAFIDKVLGDSMDRSTDKKVINLLKDIVKIFENISNNKLSNNLPLFMVTKLHAIFYKMAGKTFFRSKRNITELPYNLKNTYNSIKNYDSYIPSDVKVNMMEILKQSKDNIEFLPLKELKEKIQASRTITLGNANKYIISLNNKYDAEDLVNRDFKYLKELLATSEMLYTKLSHLNNLHEDNFEGLRLNMENTREYINDEEERREINAAFERATSGPVPAPAGEQSALQIEDVTPSTSQAGSGIQKIFNKLKKYKYIK